MPKPFQALTFILTHEDLKALFAATQENENWQIDLSIGDKAEISLSLFANDKNPPVPIPYPEEGTKVVKAIPTPPGT